MSRNIGDFTIEFLSDHRLWAIQEIIGIGDISRIIYSYLPSLGIEDEEIELVISDYIQEREAIITESCIYPTLELDYPGSDIFWTELEQVPNINKNPNWYFNCGNNSLCECWYCNKKYIPGYSESFEHWAENQYDNWSYKYELAEEYNNYIW